MLDIGDETYYTIKELSEGLFVSKSSVYEMMANGLRYSRFGGKRVVKGANLRRYLEAAEDTASGSDLYRRA